MMVLKRLKKTYEGGNEGGNKKKLEKIRNKKKKMGKKPCGKRNYAVWLHTIPPRSSTSHSSKPHP